MWAGLGVGLAVSALVLVSLPAVFFILQKRYVSLSLCHLTKAVFTNYITVWRMLWYKLVNLVQICVLFSANSVYIALKSFYSRFAYKLPSSWHTSRFDIKRHVFYMIQFPLRIYLKSFQGVESLLFNDRLCKIYLVIEALFLAYHNHH